MVTSFSLAKPTAWYDTDTSFFQKFHAVEHVRSHFITLSNRLELVFLLQMTNQNAQNMEFYVFLFLFEALLLSDFSYFLYRMEGEELSLLVKCMQALSYACPMEQNEQNSHFKKPSSPHFYPHFLLGCDFVFSGTDFYWHSKITFH